VLEDPRSIDVGVSLIADGAGTQGSAGVERVVATAKVAGSRLRHAASRLIPVTPSSS
jgi:hypothetical protein